MRRQNQHLTRTITIGYIVVVIVLVIILAVQRLGPSSDEEATQAVKESSEEVSNAESGSEASDLSDTPDAGSSSEEDPAKEPRGVYFPTTDYLQPISRVQTSEKKVAITFDASWNIDTFYDLLDILDEHNIKCTFFLVGYWIDAFPEAMEELCRRGHEIGNHSDTHPDYTLLSYESIQQELYACNDKIRPYYGKDPIVARPPSGAYNDNAIRAIRQAGMEVIQWDADSLDWIESTTENGLYENIMSKVRPGSILLFHVEGYHTVKVLPRILDELESQGYTFCTAYELIIKDDYTIDITGEQQPK